MTTYVTWITRYDPRDERAEKITHRNYRSARNTWFAFRDYVEPRTIARLNPHNPGELVPLSEAELMSDG